MITLIKSFKYDNNYDYVKMFATKTEQANYFNSLSKIVIEDTNYIKLENSFNVNYDYDYLVEQGVNYLIFNNGYRNIYAFIVKKEYVRVGVTRIVYDIDVMQTFMFDFSLRKSFVERKVCAIDEISDFDEGINIGYHKIVSDTTVITKDSKFFAMFTGIKNFEVTVDENGKITNYFELPTSTDKPSTRIDGITYPLFFMPLDYGLPSAFSDHPSLVGVVRLPACTYTTQEVEIPVLYRTAEGEYHTIRGKVNMAQDITSIEKTGYYGSIPKNEPVDFFPYTYYVLTDGETEPLVMKPQELPASITVKGKFALSHQPVERYYVEGYKGDNNGVAYNITNSNTMCLPTATSEGLSYISANGGSLKMQRTNQVVENILGGISTAVSAIATSGMSLLTGGISSIVGGINKVRETDQRTQDIMLTPSSISSFGTPSTRQSFGTDKVRILKYTVDDNIKEKIRNYNARWGNKFNNYATIDLKTYKGYIKFVSPDIDSSIDNMYIYQISNILERGVYIE